MPHCASFFVARRNLQCLPSGGSPSVRNFRWKPSSRNRIGRAAAASTSVALPVKEAALEAGLHVYQPETIKSDSSQDFLSASRPTPS